MKKIQLLFIAIISVFASCTKDSNGPEGTPSFDISLTELFLGEEVSFTNTSENASIYRWDFGDGNRSVEKDPVHQYSKAGTYTVSLQVGPSSIEKKTVIVHNGDRAVIFKNNIQHDLNITLFDRISSTELGKARYKLGNIKIGTKSEIIYVNESALSIAGIQDAKTQFIVLEPLTFDLKKGKVNELEINNETKITYGLGLSE